MKVNTYLLFDGQCEEAFKFYEKLLGGKIVAMLKHSDTPAAAQSRPEWRDMIMHAYMTVGDQVLMASDDPTGNYRTPTGFSVQLAVDSAADAKRIFGGLAEGGKVTMPLEKTFWADQFGMLVDRFGIPWMINYAPAS